MMWLWTLFEIGINMFQAYLILIFVKNKSDISDKHPFANLFCLISCTVFFSLFLFFDLPPIDMLVFVFPLLYTHYVSTKKWYQSLFWIINLAVLFNSTVGLCSHLFSSIYSAQIEQLLHPGVDRLFFVVFTNVMLLIIIVSASQIKHNFTDLSWRTLFSFFSISVCLLIIEECLYFLQNNSPQENMFVYNLGYISLLLCLLLSILLLHFQIQSNERENRYKAEANLHAMTKQHVQEFKQIYDDFNSRQHDFKHHVETLERMIAQNNTEEAQNYLTIYKSTFSNSRYFLTGNVSVDALLTAKFLTMKVHNIAFKFSPYPLSMLPISVIDFCSIIGNLLDNAIEGNLRIVSTTLPRVVSLSFARTHENFHIVCENPCNSKTLRKNKNAWISSKTLAHQPGYHGLGIQNIQMIVTKSEGHCSFSSQNDYFRVEITIPYPIRCYGQELFHESNSK